MKKLYRSLSLLPSISVYCYGFIFVVANQVTVTSVSFTINVANSIVYVLKTDHAAAAFLFHFSLAMRHAVLECCLQQSAVQGQTD